MSDTDLAVRLSVAMLAGLVLGLERERLGHPAGMRTHVLVSVGAAIFTLSGAYGFDDVVRAPTVDPARLAAQVASGIGFIGAGAILRDGGSIKGLTTAATLWLAASCGVGAGAGAYAEVAIGTGLVLMVLVGLRALRPSLWGRSRHLAVELQYQFGSGSLAPILATVKATGCRIDQIDVEDDRQSSARQLNLQLRVPSREHADNLIEGLTAIPELARVRIVSDDG